MKPTLRRKENEMKNFILVAWNANGTTTVWNLGRWRDCMDEEVKRVAFVKLETQMSQFYWSYVGDGWIEGNAKETNQQVRAFLSIGIQDNAF